MPAKIHPAVRERARKLWEKEGYSPTLIVDNLPLDLLSGKLQVPGVDIKDVVLPTHRSVINDWAKEEGWSPHWREAKKKVDQKIDQDIAEGVPFAISGIKDPIWHLSVLEAKRYIAGLKPPSREFTVYFYGKNDGLDKSDGELIGEAMVHVNEMFRPGPRVLVRLQPVIQSELKKKRKFHQELNQWFDNFDPDRDNGPLPRPPFAPEFDL
jgi:hypothetical protein